MIPINTQQYWYIIDIRFIGQRNGTSVLHSASKWNELRSRFVPRSSRQEPDGQHLDFGLVRLYPKNSIMLTQTSDLLTSNLLTIWLIELIKSCCSKHQKFEVICSERKLMEKVQLNSDMTRFKFLFFKVA